MQAETLGPRAVARVHHRREAVVGPVGQRDCVFFRVEGLPREHRSKDLGLNHLVVLPDTGQNRRLVVQAPASMGTAPQQRCRSTVERPAHEAIDPFELAGVDQGAHANPSLPRVANDVFRGGLEHQGAKAGSTDEATSTRVPARQT